MTELDGTVKARIELLLKKYDELDQAAEKAKETKSDAEAARDHVRDLLRDEITNMGLGRGTKLDVPGIGSFSFTTKRYHQLPAPNREEFVLLLIRRSLEQAKSQMPPSYWNEDFGPLLDALKGTEVALLTIGQKDLDRWCAEREDEADDNEKTIVPSYITFFEDKFVPRISLESAKVRRREKAAKKAAQRTK